MRYLITLSLLFGVLVTQAQISTRLKLRQLEQGVEGQILIIDSLGNASYGALQGLGGIYGGDGVIPTGTLASLADGNAFAIGKWPQFPNAWFDNNDNGILIIPETQVSLWYGNGTSGGTLEFYNSNTYWKYFGTTLSPQIDMDNSGLRMRTNSANSIKILPSGGIDINAGDSAPFKLIQGTGSPEGVVTANVGSIYLNRSGGAASTLYIKTSGDGTNTGWTAK